MAARYESTPDRSRIARGRWGEALAAAHYERQGYTILDTNWRSPTGELDLVLRRGSVCVFCEVKARRSDLYGPAAAAVGRVKQRRIRRLAAEWLESNRCRGVEIRFDVVAITVVRVDVIEAAF